MADPVRDAVPLTTSHVALLATVQVHCGSDAVTVTDPVPPVRPKDSAVGVPTVSWHTAAACVTVKVLPAIVTVPLRVVLAVLAATLSAAVPLPLPIHWSP